MSPTPTPRDVQYFSSTDELRDWFDANHETATELWLGYHRKSTGRPTGSWSEAVALPAGWRMPVPHAIVEPRWLSLPQLDHVGDDPVATPVCGTRRLYLLGELLGEQGHAVLELGARCEDL